jgi:hypothetical protein
MPHFSIVINYQINEQKNSNIKKNRLFKRKNKLILKLETTKLFKLFIKLIECCAIYVIIILIYYM